MCPFPEGDTKSGAATCRSPASVPAALTAAGAEPGLGLGSLGRVNLGLARSRVVARPHRAFTGLWVSVCPRRRTSPHPRFTDLEAPAQQLRQAQWPRRPRAWCDTFWNLCPASCLLPESNPARPWVRPGPDEGQAGKRGAAGKPDCPPGTAGSELCPVAVLTVSLLLLAMGALRPRGFRGEGRKTPVNHSRQDGREEKQGREHGLPTRGASGSSRPPAHAGQSFQKRSEGSSPTPRGSR